jgi:hypothetical protein
VNPSMTTCRASWEVQRDSGCLTELACSSAQQYAEPTSIAVQGLRSARQGAVTPCAFRNDDKSGHAIRSPRTSIALPLGAPPAS